MCCTTKKIRKQLVFLPEALNYRKRKNTEEHSKQRTQTTEISETGLVAFHCFTCQLDRKEYHKQQSNVSIFRAFVRPFLKADADACLAAMTTQQVLYSYAVDTSSWVLSYGYHIMLLPKDHLLLRYDATALSNDTRHAAILPMLKCYTKYDLHP